MVLTAAALGLIVGVAVGWGAGRRAERAAYAWEMTRAWYGVARMLTGQAAGFVLGCAALVALAVLAMLSTR